MAAVLPLTEHTAGELEAKVIGSPELAVAESAMGNSPVPCSSGNAKAMVWVADPDELAAVLLLEPVNSEALLSFGETHSYFE
jgi:hypothetical protein